MAIYFAILSMKDKSVAKSLRCFVMHLSRMIEYHARSIPCKQKLFQITEGPVRESNPGPRAPEARIIPLDQQAMPEYSVIL